MRKLNYFCVLCMRHTCVFHFDSLSFPRNDQIRSRKEDICIKLTEKRNGDRSSSQYLNYGLSRFKQWLYFIFVQIITRTDFRECATLRWREVKSIQDFSKVIHSALFRKASMFCWDFIGFFVQITNLSQKHHYGTYEASKNTTNH